MMSLMALFSFVTRIITGMKLIGSKDIWISWIWILMIQHSFYVQMEVLATDENIFFLSENHTYFPEPIRRISIKDASEQNLFWQMSRGGQKLMSWIILIG